MESTIYGMVAEFTTEAQILRAAKSARAEGYNRVEAYTPLPVHGLAEIIGLDLKDTLLPLDNIFWGSLWNGRRVWFGVVGECD